jgi:UDP-sugar pyrophosphorylase
VENAKKLLADSAAGVDPFKGYSPSIPEGQTLDAHTDAWLATEVRGLAAIGDCAFMLVGGADRVLGCGRQQLTLPLPRPQVAGGLGERLGYTGIKVALPTETTTGRCYLQYYCETILSYQVRLRRRAGAAARGGGRGG